MEAGGDISKEELEITLWGVPLDEVGCDGFSGKGLEVGDGILGEDQKWASPEGVKAFEVVELIGGFG